MVHCNKIKVKEDR